MRTIFRQVALAMCLIIVLSSMAACGSTADSESKKVVTSSENAAEETKEEDKIQEAAQEQEQGQIEDSGVDIESDLENAQKTVSIEEQLLIDQNDIKITATEYLQDPIWGEGIKLLLENNSDKDITIGCNALIVNDYMITDLFASSIAAGKKANETMYLSSQELEAAGINTVGKVEVYFHVFDSTSYENIFDSDCVTIQTSEFSTMDTTPDDSGLELYNEGGIRIVGKTVDENSFWGTAILLYIENTSGKNVGISVDDMSVNGFMMSPYFSTTVYNEKKAINDITLFSSDLEANGIESIDEVELKFHIYDASTYETITDSAPITFSAK